MPRTELKGEEERFVRRYKSLCRTKRTPWVSKEAERQREDECTRGWVFERMNSTWWEGV